MENEQNRLVLLAENVTIAEEAKLDPVFLKITMKLCDNAGNKNREGVTAAFISDLINRAEAFECLPFYADVKNLLAGNYHKLGHMYDAKRRVFGSTQIGALTDFYSEMDNDGVVSLYATARVPKREKDVCLRLVDLYERGLLAVSFEVRYNPNDTLMKDGVQFIDVSEDNALTGIALVSQPACVDAYALDMVAEVADSSEDIVAESEELTGERGETEIMENEKLTAEVTEETVVAEETQEVETVAETVEEIAVADGEGASESGGEGASEGSGEGASESGSDAGASSGSEGGAGASSGSEGGGSGSGSNDVIDALTIDPDDEKKSTAEEQDANAEVVSHNVETYEAVEKCPETGETMHVQVVTERVVETVDPATVIAEQEEKIAELETKIAELEQIKAQYDEIIAERAAHELAEKQAKARAFAEKQGLNVEDTAVAEAIEALDYTKIAELSMVDEQVEPVVEPAKTITLASYVEMEVNDNNTYGGLLSRKNK